MAVQKHVQSSEIDTIPETIQSAQAKLVYLFLEATGGATADDLSDVLAMKKISVLSVLRSLTTQGLVEADGSTYVVAN